MSAHEPLTALLQQIARSKPNMESL